MQVLTDLDRGGDLCSDCGKLSHPFTAVAWMHAVLGSDPILCIPCVGRRLGRSVAPWDFKPDAPANAWMQWRDGGLAKPRDAKTAWKLLEHVAASRGTLRGVTHAVLRETIQRDYIAQLTPAVTKKIEAIWEPKL
jgi:hypothetical protein